MLNTKKAVQPLFAALFAACLLSACNNNSGRTETEVSAQQQEDLQKASVQKDRYGVTVTLAAREQVDSEAVQNPVKKVRLQVVADNIIRVTATPQSTFDNLPDYLMVVEQKGDENFETTQSDDKVSVKTAKLTAEVDLLSGEVRFLDASGKALVQEANRGSFSAVIDEPGRADADSYAVAQSFLVDQNEGFYGLGQHQDGLVNYAGHNVELTTYNMVITIPFLVSSKNYGILWNNAAVSRFGDPRPAAPLQEGFTLLDKDGNKGGLTVHYYDGDTLLLTRQEADTDYQFLARASDREVPLPEEVKDAKNLRIKMEGTLLAHETGKYTLKMYSSGYAKLFIDGEKKLDRWRMNWNPWYHNLELDVQKGQKVALALDWEPEGGYLRLLQNAPVAELAGNRMSLASDTGKAIDYYLVAGDDKDEVISGYRTLTGKSVMLPKWAYGFWQSRERYKTQQEIIDNLKEYRDRKIPIDNIVLDWSYWPEDAWGSHDFDKEFFPDPEGLTKAVHDMNANIMISVWPKFYPTTENYKELNAKGFMFNKNIEQENWDWIGPGYLNAFYDAYAPEAREIFWRQLDEKINSKGFDAWWLDAVEPDIHSNLSFTHRKDLMTPNALGTGAEYFNAYALPHAETVYQRDRESEPEKRVFILTRSGYGGIQRTASAIWSGDIVSRWSNMREQIASGIGVGLSGMPNWTFDIGGFTPEDRYRYSEKGVVGPVTDMNPSEVDEWQELNTRWFQFGTFTPLFRAHGQNPYREIFNIAEAGSEPYETMVWYTKLRYQLMPYIYSEAGNMYHKDDTLMRGLVMDFGADPKVQDINDQYMFGPALLINPVYEYKARSRDVYLPSGADWYNFYTGEKLRGGQLINAAAPYSQMPIFVKAGSILPSGPDIQYVYEKPAAPVTLNVYTGADASYELYEDDGKSYGYENGAWSRIPFTYEEATGTLTIGKREGQFPEMVKEREFHVRWLSGPRDDAANFTAAPDTKVEYTGAAVTVKK